MLSLANDAIQTLFTTLNDISTYTTVPYLSEASSLALSILEAVQQCRSNKADILSLGERVGALILEIRQTCEAAAHQEGKHLGINSSESPLLMQHLKKFCETLSEIKHFALCQKDRNWFIRFLKHKSDAEHIVEFRRKLDEAMDMFTMQSLIVIRKKLDRAASAPQPTNTSTNSMFGPNFKGNISGNASFNTVGRDQHNAYRYGGGRDVFIRSGGKFIPEDTRRKAVTR
ncbi:hypothetical protein Moror_11065 [Moniliophthora roreri MCA 2997]|nr:hypothetical protein Moror_11065 [Moniliophthora roreri MCA 2997]